LSINALVDNMLEWSQYLIAACCSWFLGSS